MAGKRPPDAAGPLDRVDRVDRRGRVLYTLRYGNRQEVGGAPSALMWVTTQDPYERDAKEEDSETMEPWSNLLSVIEARGWHLYRALPTSDLSDLVAKGKVESIERSVPHVLLPAASRHNDVHEVAAHVDNAKRTNQLPTYGRDNRTGPCQD